MTSLSENSSFRYTVWWSGFFVTKLIIYLLPTIIYLSFFLPNSQTFSVCAVVVRDGMFLSICCQNEDKSTSKIVFTDMFLFLFDFMNE